MDDDLTTHLEPRLIVGVGASAGGLEAFKQLLGVLPEDSGMVFLLVQHLDPTHKSLLPELLAPCTKMKVSEANQGKEVQENTVYVIPPDTALAVRNGKIELSTPTLYRGVRLPVDHLFRSLAREFGPRAVGIVLSGAGSDGSAGIRDIKAAGGLTIAQDPTSSWQTGMPQSAIDTGIVDLVLKINDMPQALLRFASMPPTAAAVPLDQIDDTYDGEERREQLLKVSDEDLGRLAAVLEAQADFDVRVYKAGTLKRRVLRRMTLSGFEEPAPYFDFLRQDASEQQALVRDLLISVTEFFRDAEAFEALRAMVINPLVRDASSRETLRCWVSGCATGEEAYSIAMEFLDSIEEHNKKLSLQIFATDIDQEALAIARAGVYPQSIAERVSQERLQNYFTHLDGRGYQARSALRDTLSFAVHDLTKDPPFSRMALVSCRNVLIYLRPEIQKHVLNLLHFALRPDGYLFLGTSESTSAQRQLYSVVSKKWRIYKKLGISRPISIIQGGPRLRREIGEAPGAQASEGRPMVLRPPAGDSDLARRVVLKARVPPTIIVVEDGSILFMHGELRPYLRFPEGADLRFEVTSLVTPELVTRTRAALYKCRRDNQTVVAMSSPNGRKARTKITATPGFELGEGAVILTFEEVEGEATAIPGTSEAPSPEQETIIDQLEKELQATREDLRNTVEELETSNEELRSSNEEAMSLNEELQSANEELEATNEELRSLNEELTTVNVQLREKIEQVERAHDDLANFFASTKIATLFLDERLCIKRFTPPAGELLSIDHADVGRYIGDIARELLQNDLISEARSVLEHLLPITRELRIQGDRWVSRQVLPYRTESRRIEGVVITMVDITALKSATERLAVRERQQAVIARLGLHALKEPDLRIFLDQTVREVQETLKTDYCSILELQSDGKRFFMRAGIGWQEGIVGAAHIPAGSDSPAGLALQMGEPVIVDDFAKESSFRALQLLSEHGIVGGISCMIRHGQGLYGVIEAQTKTRHVFAREDTTFLQAVASMIGSAISRYQTRQRLAVEGGVAKVLAQSHEVDEAVTNVLACLGTELRTSEGELWWPTSDGNTLSCKHLWVSIPETKAAVMERFCKRVIRSGEGFIGRVFETGRASWISDFDNPAAPMSAEAARELGLVSGLAFPVIAGDDVLGVMTTFSRNRIIVNDVFLRNLEALGRSIGDVLMRLEVEKSLRQLAAIVESSHDAIVTYDLGGKITGWLGGAASLYGYTVDDMVGVSIDRLVPEGRRREQQDLMSRIRRDEVIESLETSRLCKSGNVVDVSIRASRIKDEQGRVVAIASTERDIRRQKETERRLLEADRQKDEFLAMLGHELRNPLATMKSAAEALQLSGGDSAAVACAQTIIQRQSTHMAKLLDGLLDISRIIRGKIALGIEVIDLVDVCRDVVSDVKQRLGMRKLDIQADLPSEPIWLEADPVRLTQIVDNLLSNAIKFTKDGGRIELKLKSDGHKATLEISDNGIGIDAELLPHIFEVFRQGRQHLDRSSGGLGIGLALVKSLVELHGGEVEARSEGPDRGATFVIKLPTTSKSPPRHKEKAGRSGKRHILLIEDNVDVAEMLQRLLMLVGHAVTVATHGQEGISMAKELLPDVVLCDLGLPDGLTGFDVARALRSDEKTRSLRLVAVSGYGRPEDKARSLEAGFDDHITKPIELETVQRVLADLDKVKEGGARMPA